MSLTPVSLCPRSIAAVYKALAFGRFLQAPATLRSLTVMPTPRYPPGHPLEYQSDVFDAEPLHRYRKGGYHPVHLGDRLSNGRYKVLHKLGWGGYY